MSDLLGNDALAPRARKKNKPATEHAAVRRVIDAYHDAYLARHGIKPQINGAKDGALVKRMVATWGEDVVLKLVPVFVNGDEPWAVKKGWTLAAFYEVAPRLLTSGTGRTSANVAAARRATQPKDK